MRVSQPSGYALSASFWEIIVRICGQLLLEDVQNGGCVASANQGIILTLAVLCPEDVSRVRLGLFRPVPVSCRLHVALIACPDRRVPRLASSFVPVCIFPALLSSYVRIRY